MLIRASHGWRKCGNFGWSIRGRFFWECTSSTAIAILSCEHDASDITAHTNTMRADHVMQTTAMPRITAINACPHPATDGALTRRGTPVDDASALRGALRYYELKK